jgi:hypothetical protein
MSRVVVYANGATYTDKSQAGRESPRLRRNVSLEIVEWLNSLPTQEYQGKKIKEVVSFQIGSKFLWECFALVELED